MRDKQQKDRRCAEESCGGARDPDAERGKADLLFSSARRRLSFSRPLCACLVPLYCAALSHSVSIVCRIVDISFFPPYNGLKPTISASATVIELYLRARMSWIYRKIQGLLFRYVYLRCKLIILVCSCPRCPLRRCPPAPQELQVPERGQILYFAIYLEALCSAPAALSATLLPRWLTMCLQWNAFVEVLPLWLAPNMVTLLGFFFILGNVMLLVIYTPDLVGPVMSPWSCLCAWC